MVRIWKGNGMPNRKSNATKQAVDHKEHEVLDVDDADDGKQIATSLVNRFIKMWPRAIFDTPTTKPGKRQSIAKTLTVLDQPGVYILYRDDQPFYVGQAKGKLRSRLRAHANNVGSSKNYFWNYFSAFLVKDPNHINEVEAILISAMPSVVTNSSKPKLSREKMDSETREVIRQMRMRGAY